MSIYDNRDQPAYGLHKTEPHYSNNKHILKWWTKAHDELLRPMITRWQWVWYWFITDEIVKNTPPATIELWKKEDPLCSKYAWYSILMNFADSRAELLGITKIIRPPKKKTCLLCKKRFVEDSLPVPLIERLGIDRLEFCAPCLRDTVLQGSGNESASKQEILKYLQDLAALIERVPRQNFGEGLSDLLDMSDKERVALLKLLRGKPTIACVKANFGSWLNALIQAGILEDGTRKTSRGIQCIAKDGHVCFSLGEKTIDDFLYEHGIPHVKEPRYPESNFRADFKVDEIFIEYLGLAGNPEYDAKTKQKIKISKKQSISLIFLYSADLISQKKLENKLAIFLC